MEAKAVCLSCSNEWTVRDPGVKKKRKCPVCGKYRIKLKSEIMAADANNANNAAVSIAAGAEQKEETRTLEKREKKPPVKEEKKEKEAVSDAVVSSGGNGMMYAAIAVFVVGAAIGLWFLWRPSRKKLAKAPVHEKQITVHPGVRRMMGAI